MLLLMRDREEKKIRKAEKDKGDERENSGIFLSACGKSCQADSEEPGHLSWPAFAPVGSHQCFGKVRTRALPAVLQHACCVNCSTAVAIITLHIHLKPQRSLSPRLEPRARLLSILYTRGFRKAVCTASLVPEAWR